MEWDVATNALIRCKLKNTEHMVDIAVASDGMPRRLGCALAEVCANILWGHGSLLSQYRIYHPELDLRMCMEEDLSGMIMGLLHTYWDGVKTDSYMYKGTRKFLTARYSHNQFSLRPSATIDLDDFDYVYLVEFRDAPPNEWHENPRLPWIELQDTDKAGWPSDFLALCTPKDDENTARSL
jgi:hypothetical protein